MEFEHVQNEQQHAQHNYPTSPSYYVSGETGHEASQNIVDGEKYTIQGNEVTYLSQNDTDMMANYGQYNTMQHHVSYQTQEALGQQAQYSANNVPESALLETAILAGRVYAPPSASYVPGELVARGGIATLYNSCVIPTFESDLHFVQAEGGYPTLKDMIEKQEAVNGSSVNTRKYEGHRDPAEPNGNEDVRIK